MVEALVVHGTTTGDESMHVIVTLKGLAVMSLC